MIKMKKGCIVPFPEKIYEQYEINENSIHANIGTDKIMDILHEFIDTHNEWLFFILEIPTNFNDEPKDENGELIGKHKDVFYRDGYTHQDAKNILSSVGKLLVEDGMNYFGFGGHESKEEIIFGQYNVLTIYTRSPEKYEEFFTKRNITKTDNLITAWQTFTDEYYGECSLYKIGEKDIYSIPKIYKEYGMYFAERREV